MPNFNLAVIAGDGIGPEVVAQGLRVLDCVAAKHGATFTKTSYDLGAAYWHRTGEVLPDATLAELAKSDVILLGAVGNILGTAKINIAGMQVSRDSAGGEALMAITVDSPVSDELIAAVAKETGAGSVRSVTLVN